MSSDKHPIGTPTPTAAQPLCLALSLITILIGILLRGLAISGELWLDELWSLLKVSDLASPLEIVTTVKHDNNHILNSAWMWLCGATRAAYVYRIPALLCSIVLLIVLLPSRSATHSDQTHALIWLVLAALSYPLVLYGTEARGYSLALVCAASAYIALTTLLANPFHTRAIAVFSLCGVLGVLSHAIYILFLAPAVAWLCWRVVVSELRKNSRVILWIGIAPPVGLACLLTLTFYRGMEIGGAPLLPYLEVAASTLSIAFGGEVLSAANPPVTGRGLLIALVASSVCVIELLIWIKRGDPLSYLIGMVLITPWCAVLLLQPHFILPRYFIIQILFAYLVAARFLARLAHRSTLGAVVAATIIASYAIAHTDHTLTLAHLGRSNFVAIFEALGAQDTDSQHTVGGDQDFQNGLRLAYAHKIAPHASRLVYCNDYQTAATPPSFIIRETLDKYELLPQEWRSPHGILYRIKSTFPAPQLSGSHVTVYERVE